MNLQDTISFIIKEQGASALQSPALLGMLEDFGAFKEEEPSTRTIMRELIRSGQVRKLLESKKKGRDLQFEVKTIIADTVQVCGFREEAVSETLKKVALASGKISKEKDWPELSNNQTINTVQTFPAVHSKTVNSQTVIVKQAKSATNAQPVNQTIWSRILSSKKDLFFYGFIISAIISLASLISLIYGVITGAPNVMDRLWEFIICLVNAGVMLWLNKK